MSNDSEATPISVIIPTRNRAEDLARSLPEVLALDYPNFEIVVVDQSTDDSTAQVVARAVSEAQNRGPKWRLVRAEGAGASLPTGDIHRQLVYRPVDTVGVSLSLNEGVRLARGELMAFTPDDSTVPATWLRRAAEVMSKEHEAGFVFGAVAPESHDWQHAFVPAFQPAEYRRLRGRLGYLDFRGVMGANMVIRQEVFRRVGKFDECLGTGCRFRSFEDADLGYRALRAGFTVIIDPENVVLHWGERDFSDGSAQRIIRNGRYGCGASFMKHVRCGDAAAAFILVRSAYREGVAAVKSLLRRRGFTGAGRLIYLVSGAAAGLRQPVDRRNRVYLPQGARR